MHPDVASALASQHRHEMTAKASHHAQATVATQAGGTTAHHASPAGQAGRGAWGTRLEAAASPRGPRRGTRRPHLRGALLPRYRVSWSRTALSASAPDGAGRGRSWVIVISATRGF